MVDTCEIPSHCAASFRFHFVLARAPWPLSTFVFVQYRVPTTLFLLLSSIRIHPLPPTARDPEYTLLVLRDQI